MASQIITLVGVLLGALTSYFATSVAERAKFRQTMATRWDERKLDTYIDYISCVKEAARAARQAVEAHGRDEDNAAPLAAMEAAEARRSVLFEGLMLLGDDAASRAAMTVNERLWAVIWFARVPAGSAPTYSPAGGVPADYKELSASLIEALNSLHKAARTDLAIGTP
ncbi:hypothetical protein ACWD5F_04435 [Streptomyces sp. NPDC002499]